MDRKQLGIWYYTDFIFHTQDKVVFKFRHSEKATKIWNNLLLDLTFASQMMWEIVSNFVTFLENLNFTLNLFPI